MKILLFNDNPVVRKLVALSAQKTKDDLSVVWTIEEAEGNSYDLLIIDDGIFSNEMLEMLRKRVQYKVALLMATRGNTVPDGFDHVINKPFLPTDLVDMFVQIEKNLDSMDFACFNEIPDEIPVKDEVEEEDSFSINLDESMNDLGLPEEEDFFAADELELDDFDDLDEIADIQPAVLDREEVQEVQGLLDDTENDFSLDDEAISVDELEEFKSVPTAVLEDASFEEKEEEAGENELDEFDFSELLDTVDSMQSHDKDEAVMTDNASIPEDEQEIEEISFGDFDDEMADDFSFPEEETPLQVEEALSGFEAEDEFKKGTLTDEDLLGDLDMEEAFSKDMGSEDELLGDLEMEESFDNEADLDNELDTLEMQIQEAVADLEPETLDLDTDAFDLELDDDIVESLQSQTADMSGLDELDMLDERELKLAVGEEVEEIFVPTIEPKEVAGAQPIAQQAEKPFMENEDFADHDSSQPQAGMEALQTLMKMLSNEEVAKSLKGLNISININFGNEK